MYRLYITTVFALLVLPSSVFAATISKTPPSTNSLNSGLVGWWTMDGADVNSTKAFDKSGQGNNGTRTAVTPVAGKIGQGISLPGTANNGLAITSTNLRATSTISYWIKYPSGSAFGDVPIGGASGYYAGYLASGLLYYSSGGGNFVTVTFPSPNSTLIKWTNITITRQDKSIIFYVNGFKIDATKTLPTDNRDFVFIAIGSYNGGTFPVKASMDDVRIYNRALSAKEVYRLYQLGNNTINKTLPNTNTLNSGLQGWWTMDGADVNSTKAFDKAPTSTPHNGTRTGTTVRAAGKIGQGMKFDGSTGYLSMGNPGFLDDTRGSLSMWVKFDSLTTGQVVAASSVDGSTSDEFQAVYFRGDSAGEIQISSASFRFTTPNNTITDKKWHFITETSDSSTLKVYVDGVLKPLTLVVGSNIGQWFNIATNSNTFSVGGLKRAALTVPINGSVDDVRYWSGRALSAKEVLQLYQEGNSTVNKTLQTNTLNTGLQGWWTMDGADVNSTKAFDKSGRGNNGTRTGTTALTAGKIGQGMKFDGSGAYLDVSSSAITGSQAFTLAAWFKLDSASSFNNYSGAVSIGTSLTSQLAYIGTISTAQAGTANSIGGGIYGTNLGTGVKTVGKWAHVVLTFGGGTNGNMIIYVNAVNKVSGLVTPNLVSGNTRIGRIGTDTLYDFKGSIDDVRIYNRALSAKEITQLYQMGQ